MTTPLNIFIFSIFYFISKLEFNKVVRTFVLLDPDLVETPDSMAFLDILYTFRLSLLSIDNFVNIEQIISKLL